MKILQDMAVMDKALGFRIGKIVTEKVELGQGARLVHGSAAGFVADDIVADDGEDLDEVDFLAGVEAEGLEEVEYKDEVVLDRNVTKRRSGRSKSEQGHGGGETVDAPMTPQEKRLHRLLESVNTATVNTISKQHGAEYQAAEAHEQEAYQDDVGSWLRR